MKKENAQSNTEVTAKRPAKPSIEREWFVVDAKGKTLGRFTTEIVRVLQGKHKAGYLPHEDTGAHVLVLNAKDLVVTGNKYEQKTYYHHSWYPGGLKALSFKAVFEKDPREVVVKSVFGMLPSNRLRKERMKRLHIYVDAEHPHKNVELKKLI
jgi:large subunit ribosomal protein L13